MKERVVVVNDTMQRNYRYVRIAPVGRQFDPEFKPDLTPKEMLSLGVFGGKYMTDCRKEFPASWFARAKLSPSKKDPSMNYFGINASQPLSVWKKRAGYTKTIRADGFSGTVDTTWDVAFPMKISVRSNVGKPFVAIVARLRLIADRETCTAVQNSARHCSIGHMTVGGYNRKYNGNR